MEQAHLLQQAKTVLVFDSGAGGLTVAKEILQRDFNIHLHYLADDAFYPYGKKQDQLLSDRIVSVISQAITQTLPDIIVIACNTASTLALTALRDQFPTIEFIGVVPAIKPAASISTTGHIGILATSATINRQYTKTLINDFAQQQKVYLHSCDSLVELAEKKLLNEYKHDHIIEQELQTLTAQAEPNTIDTIVLACTHFPILKQQLQETAKRLNLDIVFIDSGIAIANRVQQLLMAGQMAKGEKEIETGNAATQQTTDCSKPTRNINVELTSASSDHKKLNAYLDYLKAPI
jgi:glutamate racemase